MREKLRPLSFEARIDPATTAFVIVDVQNDFCHPEGLCGRLGDDVHVTEPMVRNIGRLLAAARAADMLVVFVRTTYDVPVLSAALAEQYERRGFPDSVCLEGTMGADFVDGIRPSGRPNEIVVTKHRYSAFWGSNIDLVLRANGIRTLVMTGISTDICVESTARDAFFRDYHIVVAGDAASSFSKTRHDATLGVLGRAFGDVVDAERIADTWKTAGVGPRSWSDAARRARIPATLSERLRPPGTALVLTDLQNDFCARDGYLAKTGASLSAIESALPRIRALFTAAREAGIPVIHVRSENGAGTWGSGAPLASQNAGVRCVAAGDAVPSELSDGTGGIAAPGSRGADFLDAFQPADGEHVVTKNRFSGFVDAPLELLLRANGIRCLVLAGLTTSGAIDSTARDAAMRDYLPVVARDCVADVDARAADQETILRLLATTYAQVVPAGEIVAHWSRAARA